MGAEGVFFPFLFNTSGCVDKCVIAGLKEIL